MARTFRPLPWTFLPSPAPLRPSPVLHRWLFPPSSVRPPARLLVFSPTKARALWIGGPLPPPLPFPPTLTPALTPVSEFVRAPLLIVHYDCTTTTINNYHP